MRSDPTNDGGLFIGQGPAARPVRYRTAPRYGSARRQRIDRAIAIVIAAMMGGPGPQLAPIHPGG